MRQDRIQTPCHVGVDFKVRAPAEAGLREGSPTYVRFASASLMLFDATTGNALG